ELECVDSAHLKTIQFEGLAEGNLYFEAGDPVPAEIEAGRSPFERRAEEAQRSLRKLNLIGSRSLSDTEAVRVMDAVDRWLSKRQPPPADKLEEVGDLLAKFTPATRGACSLFAEWLDAIID